MKMKQRVYPWMYIFYNIIQLIKIGYQYNERFVISASFNGIDLLNGLLVCGITPDTPNRIRRVEENPALLKRNNGLFDDLLNSFPVHFDDNEIILTPG